MPSTLFDAAGLAIVAYAQVDGATGTSNSTSLANSGVTVSKISTGAYSVLMPTALQQDLARDLIFVQPKLTTALLAVGVRSPVVFEVNAQEKHVVIYGGAGGTTPLDSDFNLLVLRTILP
jgi:Tfp pilus assembly protein PilW